MPRQKKRCKEDMATTDQTIRGLLLTYNHTNQALNDIRGVLSQFKDLRPTKKSYTYGNGEVKQLVALEGTIPITYKTKLYNIPLIVWLHETHPYHAPMVYVQPTATMNIKAGRHVAQSGLVTMPYITDWQHGKSDLPTLVSVLCMIFGESPPVFAKPKNQPTQAPQPQPPARPPYPVAGGNMPQLNQPYPMSAPGGYQPYPPSTGGYPTGTSNVAASQGYNPYGQPAPPYPATTTASSLGGYPGMTGNYGAGPGYPSSTPGGYPTQPTISYPQAQTTPYPTAGANAGPTAYPGYPAPTYTNPVTSSDVPAVGRQKSFGLSDDEIKESLRSAVEDKMRRRLKDMFATHRAEMDVLKNTQKDLNAGKAKLEAMSLAVEKETNECETTSTILSTAIPELQAEIEKRDNETELSPEDAIETTAPIYRQLINSFSEEQAIEDTLYILGDSLRREVISIELYLKKVRDLSRKHFMLIALIMKCREKAGLSDI